MAGVGELTLNIRTTKAPMVENELRTWGSMEIREAADGKGMPTLHGYAVKWGQRSQVIYDFREVFVAGAFTESLKRGDDVRAMVDHDPARLIGRRSAGTLLVEEDAVGLRYEITPPDTQVGRDVVASVRRKDITGASFHFRKLEDTWDSDPDDKRLLIRTVKKADLYELGPCAFPAYLTSEASVRSADLAAEARRKIMGDQDHDVAQRMLFIRSRLVAATV